MKNSRKISRDGRAGARRRAGFPRGDETSASGSPTRGFALLITITLLAFIVVLLLGLAVYTRVETSIAGNTQRQAQARENALLALNLAIAQLQKHAGPDTRVTAGAENFGAVDGTRHYTGVWNSDVAATPTPGTPVTWLVSGNELTEPDPDPAAPAGSLIPAPLAITPAVPGERTVDLIGRNTTGSATRTADYVVAPLKDITATGVPGTASTATTTIGRYAWWVGDQGIKAPVAMPDSSGAVTFAPYDSADLRNRIRQQISLGAGAAEISGAPAIEPRDSNNASLVADQRVAAFSQIAFLRSPSNASIGLTRARQNLHAWSPNNYAVLANTKRGGLRQDLSLNPSLLGTAFAAWTNFPAYMENFVPVVPDPNLPPPPPSITPPISPAYSSDPIRRRYVMTPHVLDVNVRGSHQVGPVLSDFALAFNVRTLPTASGAASTSPQPLEVRAVAMMSLWNPYTSALVPEELTVNIAGLPDVEVVRESDGLILARFSLQTLFGGSSSLPLVFSLPWNKDTLPSGGAEEDRASWLPGRVYTWRTIEDTTRGSLPANGFPTRFYTRSFTAPGEPNDGIVRPLGPVVDGSERCFLRVAVPNSSSPTDELAITVNVVRGGSPVPLGEFRSPSFNASFDTTPEQIGRHSFQFGYVFRLKESIDTIASGSGAEWLTTPTIDFRRQRVSGEAYVTDNGPNPAVYASALTSLVTAKPDRLLFRSGDGISYNEDVPLFELPRSPLLSLGALQHFRIVNSRPFMIGNPWGVGERLNNIPLGEIFDGHFFSGLVNGVVPDTAANGDLILPNPLLKPLRKPDGGKLTIDDVRALMNPPTVTDAAGNVLPGPPPSSSSSKYFLQSGAFNLNSTHVAAWTAVLRGVRFPAPQSFSFLDASATTGTADDASQSMVQSTNAQFFRFSQSAQETYKAEEGMADNDPNTPSPARTELFRRGMRTLSEAQVVAFAGRIVELMALKHAAVDPFGGPFRTLEEFLSPSALFAGLDASGNPGAPRSLLEAAIGDTNLNVDGAGNPIEFSSQYLTQADVMTALAPLLFPRSDTFVVRTYGEAVNPATSAVESRAWAEAIVQRLPEYFDRSDPPETLPGAFDAPGDPADPASPPTQAHQLNKQFGRRFKIVSFRWLTRSDI